MLDDTTVLLALLKGKAVCSDVNTRTDAALSRWFNRLQLTFGKLNPSWWDTEHYLDFGSYTGFSCKQTNVAANEDTSGCEVAVCFSKSIPEALAYVQFRDRKIDLEVGVLGLEDVPAIATLMTDIGYNLLPIDLIQRPLPSSIRRLDAIEYSMIHDGPCELLLHALFFDSD
jgi:hypothetical protein